MSMAAACWSVCSHDLCAGSSGDQVVAADSSGTSGNNSRLELHSRWQHRGWQHVERKKPPNFNRTLLFKEASWWYSNHKAERKKKSVHEMKHFKMRLFKVWWCNKINKKVCCRLVQHYCVCLFFFFYVVQNWCSHAVHWGHRPLWSLGSTEI